MSLLAQSPAIELGRPLAQSPAIEPGRLVALVTPCHGDSLTGGLGQDRLRHNPGGVAAVKGAATSGDPSRAPFNA